MTETIASIRDQIGGRGFGYDAKQLHPLPPMIVVDRAAFILERCTGKVVLDIGASGVLHAGIVEVAAKVFGIDKPGPMAPWFDMGCSAVLKMDAVGGSTILEQTILLDLDDVSKRLPHFEGVELIVCGEVLEHLSNSGWFLKRLRDAFSCPLIATVPNAYSRVARAWVLKGTENVNADHVAWHSPLTLRNLLERAGWTVECMAWYNGRGPTAEGIIAVAR